MATKTRAFFLFSLIASSCVPGFAASLTGTVEVAQAGEGIPRVFVFLQSETPPHRQYLVQTGDQGVYRFLGLPTGKYKLDVFAFAFQHRSIGAIVIASVEDKSMPAISLGIGMDDSLCGLRPSRPYDMRLIPGGNRNGILSGKVLDSFGNPLAGATVALRCLSAGSSVETTTVSKGEFRLQFPPNDCRIEVSLRNFYPESKGDLYIRESLEFIAGAVTLFECPNGNCDPKLRYKPHPNGEIVICQ